MPCTLEELLESIGGNVIIGPPPEVITPIRRSYPDRLPQDALTCKNWIGTTCCKVDPYDQTKWCSACRKWVDLAEESTKAFSSAETVFSSHNWGYNKHTRVKIKCCCGVLSFQRARHLVTCPVWITRDISIQCLPGHEGGVSD